ncbi:protein PIGBOS1 [Gouania willdenowi]|uniref:protein PIGBOS1 n=1 Tax=Gouania willdenowi TaxID=441366 RepID=UPI001055D00D|nr:protein PIGBOS1 [Gouania willdenowi]
MFRRRMPFTQLALAALLGVCGGVYIYRPYFEPTPNTSEEQSHDVPKKQSERE